MFVSFVVGASLLIIVSKIINNTYINPFSVLCTPYLVVVIANKLIGEKMGFFAIGDKTLFVVGLGLVSFFFGCCIISVYRSPIFHTNIREDNSFKLENYRIRAILYYCSLITAIGVIKALYLFLTMGIAGLTREGALVSGVVGHLLFTVYPLQPILLYYWLKNRSRTIYLLTYLAFLLIIFCSSVKYHVIGIVVESYLFIALTERKYLKKGAMTMVLFTALLFAMNYVIDFINNNIYGKVNNSFYFNHFWKYMAGAVINGDRYFSGEIGGVVSVFYKLMSFVIALPNMFIYFITGEKLFVFEGIRMTSVSSIGESSNVVDAISYLYPIKENVTEIATFILIFIAFGAIMEMLFFNSVRKAGNLQVFPATIFTFFLFFSFFGTFYINSMPWEIAVYSGIIPVVFNKRTRIFSFNNDCVEIW